MTTKKETTATTKTTTTKTAPKTTTRKTTATTKAPTQAELKALVREEAQAIAKELFKSEQERYEEENARLREELEKARTAEKNTVTDADALINVRSLTHGTLIYKNQNNIPYIWNKFGVTLTLPYRDVQYMRSAHPKFLEKALLYIVDKDIAKELQLESVYENVKNIKDLSPFLELPNTALKEALQNLPEGVKVSLGKYASQAIRNGELADLNKIKTLEEELDIELKIQI